MKRKNHYSLNKTDEFMRFIGGMKQRTCLAIELFCGRIDYDFDYKKCIRRGLEDFTQEHPSCHEDTMNGFGKYSRFDLLFSDQEHVSLGNGSYKDRISYLWRLDVR